MYARKILTEHEEQAALIQWARLQSKSIPELNMLFAIPNGGYRAKKTAVLLKKEGVVSGVPDLMLACSSSDYHGLFIEMKRTCGGNITDNQIEWKNKLNQQGYLSVICKGFDAAKSEIMRYLRK
jgi:hypothetical protein